MGPVALSKAIHHGLDGNTQAGTLAHRDASGDGQQLVSVIIPAYNAASSIDHTLRSARAQTHSNLEIIVVDDGSTDDTCAIAERHVRADARVHLVRQQNDGVAAARNAGLRRARGRYFAPLDADDVWRRDKIALQLAAVERSGYDAAIVYCWYATIDEDGEIIQYVGDSKEEHDVLDAMCIRNIVGNGSSPLILRDAALELGGYDSMLREKGAQGCEDYKLYLQLAERLPFVLVRDYLVGYRIHSRNMSLFGDTMVRSRRLVTDEIGTRRPDLVDRLQRGNARAKRLLVARNLRAGRLASAARAYRDMIRDDPLNALKESVLLVRRAVRTTARDSMRLLGLRRRRTFPIGDPDRVG